MAPASLAILLFLVQSLTTTALTIHNHTHLQLPNPLPARCARLTGPPPPGLNPTVCEDLAHAICPAMPFIVPARAERNEWVWKERSGCAIGIYFHPEAAVPTEEECAATLNEVLERCSRDSRFNAGSVNIRVLPDFAHDGETIVETEAAWIMAPWRLTL
ncbi:MAG: hypothetical protein LQ338_005988 [Usnochroma carphineum]|nr:MAG: hypothetical protein LQ338_005988 [Usnochroma carphineum]